MVSGGYHGHPWPAAVVERLGIPGIHFADGPRGCVIGPATCFPVSMARGATLRPRPRGADRPGHRRRAAGHGRHLHRGGVHEPAPPPRLGPGPGDLRRGSPPRGGAGRRPDPGPAGARDGLHEALRVQLDGGGPVPGGRDGRRTGAPRGVPAPLPPGGRPGGGLGHVGLQLGQRELVRREHRPAHRHPAHRVGLGRLRHLRLHRRAARPGAVGDRRPRDRDALPPAAGPAPARRGGRRDAWPWPTSRPGWRPRWPPCCGSPTSSTRPPTAPVLASPAHRALAREAASASMVLLRNEGEPAAGAADLGRVAVLGRLAAVANLGDGGSSDVYPPEVSTLLDGIRGAFPSADVVHHDTDALGGRRRRPGGGGGRLHQGRRGRVHRRGDERVDDDHVPAGTRPAGAVRAVRPGGRRPRTAGRRPAAARRRRTGRRRTRARRRRAGRGDLRPRRRPPHAAPQHRRTRSWWPPPWPPAPARWWR